MKKLILLSICLSLYFIGQAAVLKSVNCTAGSLSTLLTTTEKSTVTDLTITGTIDARDFKTMRDNMPLLAVVDMRDASIAVYSGTDGTVNGSFYYSANEFPANAFYDNSIWVAKKSLTSLLIPKSATSIGLLALCHCIGLKDLSIPSSVTTIKSGAFGGCTKLATINIYSVAPISLTASTDVLINVPTTTCVLHVPVGSKTAYQGAAKWQDFTTIMEDLVIATLTTQAASNIGTSTATGNANITGLGADNPTQYGVVWSTATSPTVALATKTTQGAIAVTGAFTSDIIGLIANTKYYVRPYITNSTGTYYGSEVSFTTLTPNNAPTDITLSASAINENVVANSAVGTLSSTDPDVANTFTYTLVAGTGSTDNASFNISGSSLRITASPDYETKSSYSVRVRTTDQGSLTSEKAFTITINNLNESPSDITLSASAINENVVANSAVGTLSSTDPDVANTFTYTLVAGTGSTDNASFNISGSSLCITASPDYETKSSYSVRVRTTDGGNLFFEKAFTVTINNVNEAPVVTTNDATNITSIAATLNGTVNANNASTAVTFEYGITIAYGSTVTATQSPVIGTSATSVSASLTGLFPNTTYYYRVVGVNTAGTTNGSQLSFSTFPIVEVATNCNSSTLGLTGSSDVEVAAGVTLTLDGNATINSLILAPTAKLSLGANTLNVPNGVILQSSVDGTATILGDNAVSNATVQQYVSAGRNWYISSPLSSAGYANLSRGISVVEWNEATKNWDTKSSGTLTRGRGYIQIADAVDPGTTGTLSFDGTTNAGNVNVAVTRTESGGQGFNLVGNPYPSYLNWSGFIAEATNANISRTFWYRTKNTSGGYTFVTYNGVGGTYVTSNGTANTAITGKIPPMQAFWIRVNSGTASTTARFTNAMREHRDADLNKFKAPKVSERASLRLQLINGEKSDETMIYFDENAANQYDDYDSPKMMNNSDVDPDLYTKAGNERLVINGLKSVTDNLELPLGFSLNAPANLKIRAGELVNFGSGTRIYLLDKAEKTQTELYPETEYSFNTKTATTNNENRFSLLFRTPGISTGVDKAGEQTVNVFVDANNQLIVAAPLNSSYAIYNAMGQLMENGVITSNSQTSNFKHAAGVYIVKVLNNGKELTSRIIIK